MNNTYKNMLVGAAIVLLLCLLFSCTAHAKELWYEYNDGNLCDTTCYCLCPKCCGKNWQKALTASGVKPERYVTCANGKLPFGTKIYIDNVGYRIVQDRGSGVGPNHFDIYVGVQNHQFAKEWGNKRRKVWVIKDE